MITGPLWLMVLWVLALPAMGAFGAFLQWCASDRRGCPCVECRAIQVVDPLRHFTGCSKREPLPEGHPQAAPKPVADKAAEDALPDQSTLYGWYLYTRAWALGAYEGTRPSSCDGETDYDNALMTAQAIGLDQGHLRKYGADRGDPDTALLTADDLEARVHELLGFDVEDDDESCTDGIDLLACPMCGGDIIEIRPKQRGGNTFWGCSNYTAEQKCDFKLWQKPVQKIGRQRTDLKRNARPVRETSESSQIPSQIRTDSVEVVKVCWSRADGDGCAPVWTQGGAERYPITTAPVWLAPVEIMSRWPTVVPPVVEDAIVENCAVHLKTRADHAESASLREYGYVLAETMLDVMTS